jgi:hypothetical protein
MLREKTREKGIVYKTITGSGIRTLEYFKLDRSAGQSNPYGQRLTLCKSCKITGGQRNATAGKFHDAVSDRFYLQTQNLPVPKRCGRRLR